MKKLLLIAVAGLALYQTRDKIEAVFASPAADTERGEVVLYATAWCGYCAKTRELLADLGVEYLEYDIERSEEGRRQFEALRGRGVPVLKVGEQVVYGYDRERMVKLLR